MSAKKRGKATIAQKREWLELHENGVSEVSIAAKARRDIRTVKKGIDDARRERDVRLARTDLLREALRRHQDSLDEELRTILRDIVLPSADHAALPWQGKDSVLNGSAPGVSETDTPRPPGVGRKRASEPLTVRGLLRQHLGNDKLWKYLALWQSTRTSHLASRRALQLKVVALIKEVTGHEVTDKDNGTRPLLYSYTAPPLFYQAALNEALGLRSDGIAAADVFADSGRGTITYRGLTLAEAPGTESSTKASLITAYQRIRSSAELAEVIATFKADKKSTAQVKQAVDELLMLGYVPGVCDICRRLGL